jgi:putative transposase
VVARVLQINRTGLYRTPKRRPVLARRPLSDPVDRLIVEVAQANPTDGTRMVAALASQELGRQVNRKRAQRVMRQQRLCNGTGRFVGGAAPASSGSNGPTSSGTST